MGRGKGKKTKSLEDKIRDLDEHFLDEVVGLNPEQLKDKLASLMGHQEEIEEARADDEDLKSLEEQVKTAKLTYTEPLKAIKLKKTMLVRILKDQGKL
jgi:FtsZ-binding cell division protein ZapB